MPPSDAEKTKAQRARTILFTVMAAFIVLPIVLYWFFR